jgi:hypothetical protein
MKTKNYAELSSLKWGGEDFDINVERAYNAGHITEKRMNELLSLADSYKIAVIEDAIDSIELYIMEQINDAIYESVTDSVFFR